MIVKTLSTLRRTALAVAALSVISTAAHAGFSVAPDPFFGNAAGVDLQAAAGTLMALPGVGPGGATLYANNFHIGSFAIVASDQVGADLHVQYSANFHVDFLKADGTPAGGFADLTGAGQSSPVPNGFHVTYLNRNNVFQTGIYDMVLDTATFSGTSSIGGPLYVSLAGPSNGKVDISTASGGGYNITYLTPFTIQGQYTLNSDGSGTPTTVPPLGDANGQPAEVPVPATAALAIPGLLAMAGLRRRRAAVAAA